jgi:hypothetical protein
VQVAVGTEDAVDDSKENIDCGIPPPQLPRSAAGRPSTARRTRAMTAAASPALSGHLRSLTPHMLEDIDDMGLSPMMMQRPLYHADRQSSVGRPLQPQSSAAKSPAANSQARSPSRRAQQSVHVTPPHSLNIAAAVGHGRSDEQAAVQNDGAAVHMPLASGTSAAPSGSTRVLPMSSNQLTIRTPAVRLMERYMLRTPEPASEPERQSRFSCTFDAPRPSIWERCNMTDAVQLTLECAGWLAALCIAAGAALIEKGRIVLADRKHRTWPLWCLSGGILLVVCWCVI